MPVPLRSWLPMDQPARDAYLDRLRSAYDRAFRLPELPVVSEWQELPSTPDGWPTVWGAYAWPPAGFSFDALKAPPRVRTW